MTEHLSIHPADQKKLSRRMSRLKRHYPLASVTDPVDLKFFPRANLDDIFIRGIPPLTHVGIGMLFHYSEINPAAIQQQVQTFLSEWTKRFTKEESENILNKLQSGANQFYFREQKRDARKAGIQVRRTRMHLIHEDTTNRTVYLGLPWIKDEGSHEHDATLRWGFWNIIPTDKKPAQYHYKLFTSGRIFEVKLKGKNQSPVTLITLDKYSQEDLSKPQVQLVLQTLLQQGLIPVLTDGYLYGATQFIQKSRRNNK